MGTKVTCPSCGLESPSGNFCTRCAARLDATSAETALMAGAAPASRFGSSTSLDEGRFFPALCSRGAIESRACWGEAVWARFTERPISPSAKRWR